MPNSSQDALVGTKIREYEILDIIGKGGMGAVYRARHVYLDEERAIKVINSAQLASGSSTHFIDRFIREARILTKLRHPNLVELYEFGRLDESMFFMVMELIRGESVLQRIKSKNRIPVQESLKIIREAARGLQLAHQKGIIHRDISPDNLLLVKSDSEEEITKVIDFGIAKPTIEETHRYTMENMFLGKPEYSSPEQCGFHEEGEEIDQRSDIYSLTITLYYMLAGKLPFFSVTPQGWLMKHASEAPKPISTHFGSGVLPEGVEALISKALSKRRDERQASMGEFIQELDKITNREPSSPAITPSKSRFTVTEFKPGELFAKRYLIESKLGRGGMGVVYKATDKILEVSVALKTMNPGIGDDERTLSRLKREVILARKVAHPNVCRIYDIGESDGIHYVSMEFLEGRSLADVLLQDGALTPERGVPMIRQVLEALEAAHKVGILHRDLKPQNIIVDKTDRPYIMDFGISTSSEVSRLTQTGALIGTPRYMAPEQFGDRNHVDHRADIYSIGIIMFEMFTGMLPFEANTPASVMYAHLNSTPPKPSVIAPDVPFELEEIILKALEKDPKNRFQTIWDFLRAIEPLDRRKMAFATTQAQQLETSLVSFDEMAQKDGESPLERSGPRAVATPLERSGPGNAVPPLERSGPSRAAEPSLERSGPGAAGPALELSAPGSAASPLERSGPGMAASAGEEHGTELVPSPLEKSGSQRSAPSLESSGPGIVPSSLEFSGPGISSPTGAPVEFEYVSSPKPSSKKYLMFGGAGLVVVLLVAGGIFFSKSGKETSGLKQPPLNQVTVQNAVPDKKSPPSAPVETKVETAVPPPAQQTTEPTQQTTEPAPLTTEPAQQPGETPVQQPGATEGIISYQGSHPVSIYNQRKLVLNTASSPTVKLPPGQYTFTLVSTPPKALIRDVRKVEVKAGETTVIQAPAMASLNINARPGNCKIFIDGVYIDFPPIFNVPVQAGRHQIRIVWEKQGKEKSGTLDLAGGESKSITSILDSESPEAFQVTN